MPSKEIGVVFDPEIHGPGQMRFGFNGSRTLEFTHPISVINNQLCEIGIFPDTKPEDLPLPHPETATQLLRILTELDQLGCNIERGVFVDRADNYGEVGKNVIKLKTEIKALVSPNSRVEETSPQASFTTALRETPLVKSMVIRELQIDQRKLALPPKR